ncbi:hypothetical protein [Paraburkholderia sp. 2C]|jgi:hypothetical protein
MLHGAADGLSVWFSGWRGWAARYRRARCCDGLGIRGDDDAFDFLVHRLHQPARRPLLACYPRDLLSLVVAHATYREEPPAATPDTLQRAWNSYFASGGNSSGAPQTRPARPGHAGDVIRRFATA